MIGSGEICRRNSDFDLPPERDTVTGECRRREEGEAIVRRLRGDPAVVMSLMRTLLSPCVASIIATGMLAGTALAGRPPDQASEHKKQDNGEAVFVTGSLIPQRIKLKRIGTTTVSPIRIIDRREIDATGRRTTRGVLIADPSVRVLGH